MTAGFIDQLVASFALERQQALHLLRSLGAAAVAAVVGLVLVEVFSRSIKRATERGNEGFSSPRSTLSAPRSALPRRDGAMTAIVTRSATAAAPPPPVAALRPPRSHLSGITTYIRPQFLVLALGSLEATAKLRARTPSAPPPPPDHAPRDPRLTPPHPSGSSPTGYPTTPASTTCRIASSAAPIPPLSAPSRSASPRAGPSSGRPFPLC